MIDSYIVYGFATSIVASGIVSSLYWIIPYNFLRPKMSIKLKSNTPSFEKKVPDGKTDPETYLSIAFDVSNESKTNKTKKRNAAYNVIAYLELWDRYNNIAKVQVETRSVLRGEETTSINMLSKESTLCNNDIKRYKLYISYENKVGAKFISKQIEENIVLQPNEK